MYAAIRQGKARAGMAEELARRIKDGVIPIASDVPGFRAYYVVYAPDDTVTAGGPLLDVGSWPNASVAAMQQFGRYRGESGHCGCALEAALLGRCGSRGLLFEHVIATFRAISFF
jgi:hypothetical protein